MGRPGVTTNALFRLKALFTSPSNMHPRLTTPLCVLPPPLAHNSPNVPGDQVEPELVVQSGPGGELGQLLQRGGEGSTQV